jgi:hypothetical protein
MVGPTGNFGIDAGVFAGSFAGDQFVQVTAEEAFGNELYFAGQLLTEGALEASHEITLPGNALVDKFELLVTAHRAAHTLAQTVAQLRTGVAASGGDLSLVIDLGSPRTVSAISVPPPFKIVNVTPWTGSGFDGLPTHLRDPAQNLVLPSEVRSERLRLEILQGTGDVSELLGATSLVLPDSPSDLELRIDAGPPVWRHPGPAQPATATALSLDDWNNAGRRLVDVTDALAALVGDPLAQEDRTFRLTLTSRTAGFLAISVNDLAYRRIRRADFSGQQEATLTFTEEGEKPLALTALGLPAAADVTTVRFTAVGEAPPERVLPPIGPDPSPLVELTLSPDRAGILRLPAGTGLASLTGLRLPVAVASGGAELRLALWSPPAAQQPADPLAIDPDTVATSPEAVIEAATGTAVMLDGGDEAWRTVPVAEPYDLTPGQVLWAAVLVTRGEVTWRLTTGGNEVGRLLIGPPGGPWGALPALFQAPGYADLRGRFRVVGLEDPEAPIAPIYVAIDGQQPILPNAKGVAASVANVGTERTLHVVSRTTMELRLRQVDIISTE